MISNRWFSIKKILLKIYTLLVTWFSWRHLTKILCYTQKFTREWLALAGRMILFPEVLRQNLGYREMSMFKKLIFPPILICKDQLLLLENREKKGLQINQTIINTFIPGIKHANFISQERYSGKIIFPCRVFICYNV